MTRNHLWIHAGLAAAMLGGLGLAATGVAVPVWIIYLLILACPLIASRDDGEHAARRASR